MSLTPEARAHLERAIRAQEILEERRRQAPLFYFEPHPKQLAVIEGFVSGTRIGIFNGGNRVGKTTIMVYLLLAHFLGYWPHLLPQRLRKLAPNGYYPFREDIPREYWVYRSDGVPLRSSRHVLAISGLALDKGIAAIVWPKLESMLTPDMKKQLKPRRGPQSAPVFWECEGFGSLRLGSQRQGPMEFEGAAYDFIAVDEPIQKAVFTAAWRGAIDYRASLFMGFTPLGTDAPWVYKEFIAADRDDVNSITASQAENPHLLAEAVQEFDDGVQWTEEERLARKHGRWGHLSHRAFPTFDPSVHVIAPWRPPHSWPVRMAVDPANRRPFFYIWLGYDTARETWIVFDEWPNVPYMRIRSSAMSVRDYVVMTNMKEADLPDGPVLDRKMDPRFGVASYSLKNEKHPPLVEDFAALGMYFDTNIPDIARIETGIVRIRELLSYDKDADGRLYRRPKLLVCANCINTIEALSDYAFVPPGMREEHRLDEKMLEAHKDVIDALRYAILPGPPVDPRLFEDPTPWNDPLAKENHTWLDGF